MKEVLRFGVMCNDLTYRTWELICIEELLKLENVELALIILNAEPKWESKRSLPQRFAKVLMNRDSLWNQYLYRIVYRRAASLQPIDVSDRFASIPKITCRIYLKNKWSQYFLDEDLERIRSYELDFIIRFGFNIIRGAILSSARCGIWSYHHDDIDVYRGSPPAFWEIYRGDHVTGVVLQRLTDRLDGGVILKRGYFATVLKSYIRNLDAIFFGSVDFAASVVKDIRAGAATYLNDPPSKTTAPIYKSPRDTQTLMMLLLLGARRIVEIFHWLFRHEQWNVGVVDLPIHQFLTTERIPKTRWLPQLNRNEFVADPFAILRDDSITLILEHYDQVAAKGTLACITWENGKKPASLRRILDRPYHLSYPYLIEHDTQIYCIPESVGSKQVSLYRASSFPESWEYVGTLIDNFEARDPTVFYGNGRWWLFCAHIISDSVHKLYAFYASELTGPWIPHACNPLKTDVRSTRPAGTPFRWEGHWYRPAQDCSKTYGGSIVINQIERLSPTEFKERVVREIGPDKTGPFDAGCHTISSARNHSIIDGKRWRFIPICFWRQLSSLLRIGASGG